MGKFRSTWKHRANWRIMASVSADGFLSSETPAVSFNFLLGVRISLLSRFRIERTQSLFIAAG